MRNTHYSLTNLVAVVLLAALFSSPASAQSRSERAARKADSIAVHRAVLDYVEGFYEGDTAKMIRSIRPEVAKSGFSLPRDSTQYVLRNMAWSQFLDYARRVKASNNPAPATAPKVIKVFDVQDQTASAKLRASWGTDYLLLGKYDGRWMISHVVWQSLPPKNSSAK